MEIQNQPWPVVSLGWLHDLAIAKALQGKLAVATCGALSKSGANQGLEKRMALKSTNPPPLPRAKARTARNLINPRTSSAHASRRASTHIVAPAPPLPQADNPNLRLNLLCVPLNTF